MGILNLKYRTANKFIKNQLDARNSANEFEVKIINKVGVLAEASLLHTYDFTKRLGEAMRIEPEDMRIYLFDAKANAAENEAYRSCSEKDFGLFGKIKSEGLNKFVSRDLDLLINYCDSNLVFPKVIMLRSSAKLKAGFEDESNFFNDISIQVASNDIDNFNKELIKYLEILKLL